jgi:hypothetical protein
MATYSVTHKYLLDNYAVLQLLTPSEIAVGESITVASVDATFNGTYTVYALPEYLYLGIDTEGDLIFDVNVPIANQVLYAKTASDVSRVASTGSVTYTQICTWITAQNILDWLGITVATASDQTFTTTCAAASNAFCSRRRNEAGYTGDSLTTVPSQDVFLGTVMYGGMLYKSRGTVDVFSSFQDMGQTPVVGMNGQIKQLLGIDRPACA